MNISKEQSDAYLDGWACAHKGGLRITDYRGKLFAAWMKGFDDSRKGVIDADWAVTPQDREPQIP